MTTSSSTDLKLADVDFNRRDHPDRPLRPVPPGRDYFAERWRPSREFLFGPWIDIDDELGPNDFTRLRDDYFWQPDEWSIPLVDLFEREGSKTMRPLFERALTQGIDSVPDAPPELVDFFTHVTDTPAWFDRASAERGRVLASSASLSAIRVTVGWALLETGLTGDISAATGATGRFQQDPVRRYAETFRMFALAFKPDIYDPRSEVFQTVVRVRLMHVLASRGLRRAWGDEHYLVHGEPIAATSMLGFGNGPLLTRLIDHRLGRRLSARDLDDIAMFAGWFGHLIGAPEQLRPTDGVEMVRSLNYVIARGGDPSGWREEIMRTVRQPFRAVADAYAPWLPAVARRPMLGVAYRGFSEAFLSPLVPVFGLDPVAEAVDGVPAFQAPFRTSGWVFDKVARVNARATGARDRVPGMRLARRRLYRNGPPGIDQAVGALSAFAERYHGIAMEYTAHDESPSGRGIGAPRPAERDERLAPA